MQNINNIFKKLNIIERNQLNTYIKGEILKQSTIMKEALSEAAAEREKSIVEENKTIWNAINDNLTLALREHRVSAERIEKIYTRIFELINKNPKSRLFELPEQPSKNFEILTKEEYLNLIEELLECNCKGCIKDNKNCNLYKLLKKHNIPFPDGYLRKCKYGY